MSESKVFLWRRAPLMIACWHKSFNYRDGTTETLEDKVYCHILPYIVSYYYMPQPLLPPSSWPHSWCVML